MVARVCGSHVVVNSLVFDSVVGKGLAICPYLKRVSLSPSKAFPSCWNGCDLDKGHCDCHGRRLKFSSYGMDSLKVCWICPKIVDLSFLKGDIHEDV